jgi:hypothetical protein
MRTLPRFLACLAFVSMLGCATYRSMPTDQVPPSSTVRVQFLAPQTVVVEQGGDTISLSDVVSVEGLLSERTPEAVTLAIRLARVANPTGPTRTVRFADGAVTRIATQVVERRSSNSGATAVLVAIAVIAVLVIGIAAAAPDPEPQPKTTNTTKA